MKKVLFVVLLLSLSFIAMTSLSFAEVDATTSATTEPAPTAPTPKAPALKPAAEPAAPTTKSAAGSVYTVADGDVFWKIAKNHGLTIDQLAKLNPQVKNINLIYVGQKLHVKTAAAAAVADPAPAAKSSAPAAVAKKLYHGFGESANYRIRGAQKDNLNITTASAIFDQDGKIVNVTFDVMEITYALFPGWLDPEADQATKDAFVAAIDDKWETKREEGYDYDMTHLKSKGAADNATKKEWFEQLDFYESFFKGMTVAEVEAWFNKYTDANGRPYKLAYPDKLTDTDKAATANFTSEEKAMLIDVTTSATMALEDPHSHFITALKEAYDAREEIK